MEDREERLWCPVSDVPTHPLAQLEGRPLGEGRLAVRLGPPNRVGAHYFQVLLRTPAGALARPPLLLGLHRHGPLPPHNWVEVIACTLPPDQEEALLTHLAALIPPGGHVMVEYDSDGRQGTERALTAGTPPLLTPLGLCLFRSGLCGGFKDWAIAEGWSEGPRKLQAFKPLDDAHRRAKARELAQEVAAFLERRAEGLDGATLQRARQALALLDLRDAPQVAARLRRLVEQSRKRAPEP